jgi:hypothetical protein
MGDNRVEHRRLPAVLLWIRPRVIGEHRLGPDHLNAGGSTSAADERNIVPKHGAGNHVRKSELSSDHPCRHLSSDHSRTVANPDFGFRERRNASFEQEADLAAVRSAIRRTGEVDYCRALEVGLKLV